MVLMVFKFRVLSLIAFLPLGSFEFICPGPIYPPEGLRYAHIESNISGRASQEYAKIRIELFHDPSIMDKPYKELVQEGADFWSNSLSVKPHTGPIFVVPECKSLEHVVYKASEKLGVKEMYCLGSCKETTKCNGVEIPKEFLDGCKYCNDEGNNCSKNNTGKGAGVENADLIFYVSAIDTKDCQDGKTLAYANSCEMHPILDRPLFAIINICPKQATHISKDDQVMLRTIKHEMMHALGFGIFMYFRDSDGEPLWLRDKKGEPKMDNNFQDERVLKTIERDWHVRGHVIKTNQTFLVTPKVVNEARAHFNCQDLEGAELEDFGGNGTRHGHFEARVFYDEGMRGDLGAGKVLFSRVAFAVLDDSGWYQVNYSQAEEMEFGRNLGCDFCKKSCKFWMDKRREEGESIEPFCDSPDLGLRPNFSCYGTEKLFSGCPLKKHDLESIKKLQGPYSTDPYNELPRKYQHFDNISGVDDKELPQWGSFDKMADFCPIPVLKSVIPGESNAECEKLTTMKKTDTNESEKDTNDDKMDANQDEEHQMNQSSQFRSSFQFVFLLARIVVMLLRYNF